ncbi:MAG: phytanoyl-CoA dioxygenase family protein [Deltaproteobacteria bacterium]|nr:MAG: phytanoyl-CoA dioxygenase family protein [Deltaproteobacteria bacterium]
MDALGDRSEWQRRYEADGYLVIPKLFGPDELAPWHRRFVAIVTGAVPPARDMLVMKDVMVAKGAVKPESPEAAIAKVQDFHNDPVLFGYVTHPKLLAVVEAFVGPDIKSIHTMLINKPPNVDGRHALHQDLLYFPFRPADRIIAAWTAIEPCTRANGCLCVIPGSHREALLEHENPDWEWLNLGYFGAKGVDGTTERTHLEMEPGDTVFFHPRLLHGSGRNRTRGFRRAISAHFASAACRYLDPAASAGGRRPFRLVRGREHDGAI